MEGFFDATTLARLQFAGTALYHYMFVPLSIGFGLILALFQTRAYKTRDPKDIALARFWVKLFTGTFAVGVATGITLEFAFGTNWADYSRFVGDIFGAPLAAEALFAFFLESVFLGVLLFGAKKVSPKFYMASSWLVFGGSCLSALWILIASSWMQTPAGYTVVETATGSKAVMTSFFAAALNHSTLVRYYHVITALLVTGALFCLAIGVYYRIKNRADYASGRFIKVGLIVGAISTVLLMSAAHMQAVEVADYQPAKLAAIEGQYEAGPVELSFFGWVDEDGQTTHSISIPGGTSFLADWDFHAEYPGLNDFPADERPTAINFLFQTYHGMVAFYVIILFVLVLGFLELRGKLGDGKWAKRARWLMVVGPIAPIAAIELGWFTAEVGRQPWIVYGELKTADAVSQAVDPWQLIITLLLFLVIYTFIYVVWFKSFLKIVRTGPEVFEDGDKPLLGRIMSAVKTTAAVTVGGTEAVEAGLDAADDLEDDLLDEEVAR